MLKDIVGKEVKIGDFIVYPRRSGSALWMAIARVVDILSEEQYTYYGKRTVYKIRAQKDSGRIVTVSRFDNIVKIEENFDGNDS